MKYFVIILFNETWDYDISLATKNHSDINCDFVSEENVDALTFEYFEAKNLYHYWKDCDVEKIVLDVYLVEANKDNKVKQILKIKEEIEEIKTLKEII
jgi:hypothetical protein